MAKFEVVNKLPDHALTLAEYAEANGMHRSYPAVKYTRHLDSPETYTKPPFIIVSWKGHNYVIPDQN